MARKARNCRLNRGTFASAILAIECLEPRFAPAVDVFSGAFSASSWHDPRNWSLNREPGLDLGDTARIQAVCRLSTGEGECAGLEVTGGGNLDVGANTTLDVRGQAIMRGVTTIYGEVDVQNTVTITGTVEVRMFTTANPRGKLDAGRNDVWVERGNLVLDRGRVVAGIVHIEQNATLSGTGFIRGGVESAGTIDLVGNSFRSINVSGNLGTAGGRIRFEFGPAQDQATLIQVQGNVDINANTEAIVTQTGRGAFENEYTFIEARQISGGFRNTPGPFGRGRDYTGEITIPGIICVAYFKINKSVDKPIMDASAGATTGGQLTSINLGEDDAVRATDIGRIELGGEVVPWFQVVDRNSIRLLTPAHAVGSVTATIFWKNGTETEITEYGDYPFADHYEYSVPIYFTLVPSSNPSVVGNTVTYTVTQTGGSFTSTMYIKIDPDPLTGDGTYTDEYSPEEVPDPALDGAFREVTLVDGVGTFSGTLPVGEHLVQIWGEYGTWAGQVSAVVLAADHAPKAVDDYVGSPHGDAIVVPVLANDQDEDAGDYPFISDFTQGSQGTVTDNLDGTLSYEPDEEATGSDSFTYTIEDRFDETSTATVYITLDNQSPVAYDQTLGSPHGAAMALNLAAFDPDNDELTVTIDDEPTKGEIAEDDGVYYYTPDEGQTGIDTFTYHVSDGYGGTSSTVTVTINLDNQDPTAGDDYVGSPHGDAITVSVLSNDFDADNDELDVTIEEGDEPSQGTAVVNEDGTITYTPDEFATGTDSFIYTVGDGYGGTTTATVFITLDNQAPVAEYDEANTYGDEDPLPIYVLNNDSDPDSDELTVSAVGSASQGTVEISEDESYVIYTPDEGASGVDSFTYTVSDGYGGTSTQTVIVHLANRDPVARDDDVFASPHGNPINIYVLDNDGDLNGDTLTIDDNTEPSQGEVTLSTDGTYFIYTPDEEAEGSDSFDYTISDGHGGTSTATVSINLDNQDPVANDDDFGSPHGAAMTLDVLANDFDGDWDWLDVEIDDDGTAGTVVLNDDGTITYTPPVSGTTDTFSYTIDDSYGTPSTATVTIHLANQAPTANDESVGSPHGAAMVIDVLSNDIDLDGDTLTPHIDTNGSHGTAVVNGDGTITYTPTGSGTTDTFTYYVTDSHSGTSSSATVTIHLGNQSPVLTGDNVYAVDWTIAIDPLLNDFDPDGDTLTITSHTSPSHGILFQSADGTFIYTPTGEGDTQLTDTFTYTVSDGHGGSDTATVTINPAPVFGGMTVNGGDIYARDYFGATPELAGQNSIVEQMLVDFDTGVTLDDGAFTMDALDVIINFDGVTQPAEAGDDVVDIIATPVLSSYDSVLGGYKQYILTFGAGDYVNWRNNTAGDGNQFGTLKDGFYRLNLHGENIHSGGTLDGATAEDSSAMLWTLFGCHSSNDIYLTSGELGDGESVVTVLNSDLIAFNATYGSSREFEDPPYNVIYDWNLDGSVLNNDLTQFGYRYGVEWQF